MTIGCFIRQTTWCQKLPGAKPLNWLAHLDLMADEDGQIPFDQATLHLPNTIYILPQKGREVWLGQGVFEIFNRLCKTDDFAPLGTGVVLIADDAAGYYGVQEFFEGQAGWGGQVMSQPPQIWNRPQVVDAGPSATQSIAFSGISTALGAAPGLIERCITGQNSKGRYGIAWHGEKRAWVLAMMGAAGPGQFQELDPDTYGRRGIPFDALDHPDGWPAFWRQNDLLAAVQDHLSRAWCDISLSEMQPSHPHLTGPCQKVVLKASP